MGLPKGERKYPAKEIQILPTLVKSPTLTSGTSVHSPVNSTLDAVTTPTPPFAECPAVGLDTSCELLVVVTDTETDIYQDPSQGTYDGADDTLIGLLNESSEPLTNLAVSGDTDLFGFDGDGVCDNPNATSGIALSATVAADCAENTVDTTTYGGPDSYFTDINAQASGGIVNFINSIGTGASTFFSLEEALTATTVVSGGPSASEEGGAPNGSEHFTVCQSQSPVNCATGEFWHQFTDFNIPGRGAALNFTRTYVSGSASVDGPLGFGWTDSYNWSLSIDSSGDVTVNQDDGSTVGFANVSGTFVAPPRVLATLVQNADGSYTFTRFSTGVAYNFSSAGVLQSEVDRNGYVTTLNYSGSQLSSVSDPVSRELSFTYSGSNISQITDPMGRTETFTYDANGNLIKTKDPLGRSWAFTYDSNHLLLSMTDPNGGTTTNTYNSADQVISQTNPLGQKTTWAYTGDPTSPAGGTTTITDPHGSVTVEDYSNLELMSVTTASGTSTAATTSYTYDPATLGITSVTDPNGHVTTNTYDVDGNRLSTTDALGNTTTYTYNGYNEVTSETTPLGETTSYDYDANGNLLDITDPLGNTYSLTYGDSSHPGDLTSVTDPDGHTSTLTYDSQGDEASVTLSPTSGVNDTTEYVYNLDGERTCTASADAVATGTSCPSAGSPRVADTTTNTYDADGELTAATNAEADTTSYAYDADGNLLTETDPDSNQTTSKYDLLNRPVSVTTGANGSAPSTTTDLYDLSPGSMPCASDVTGTAYCAASENADGGASTSYYNAANEVIEETLPGGNTVQLGYDLAGNNTSKVDAAGQTTTFTYDADNHVTAEAYSDGTTPGVTYSYTADGQVAMMVDGTGTTTYSYDADGRLSATTDGAGAEVSYTYDAAGKVLTITYPDSRVVSRSYDGAGRLASISDGGGDVSMFAYDADGNLTNTVYPNGDTVTSSYDPADQLIGTGVVSTADPSSELASIDYTRDADGQITQESDSGALTGSTAYSYNANAQLSSSGGSSYTYDALGDLVGLPGDVTQAFNTAQELTQASSASSTTTYSYNADGDLTSSSDPGATTSYGYNQANELTSFTPPTTAPPTFTSGASDSVPTGTAFTYSVTTSGTPTPAISLASGSTLPSGVTLKDNNNGTATLAGTSSVVARVYTFTIQAANGVTPNAMQPFTLTVTSTTAKPQPTRISTMLTGTGAFSGGRIWWLADTITVFSGAAVTDSATLTGANASSAGGTVTYTVYSLGFSFQFPFFLWKTAANGGTVTVTGGSVPNSKPVTLQPGVYQWQASYSGDSLNKPSTSPLGSETEIVVPTPACRYGWHWGFDGGCSNPPASPGPQHATEMADLRVGNSHSSGPSSRQSTAGALRPVEGLTSAVAPQSSSTSSVQDPTTYTYNGDGLRTSKDVNGATQQFTWDSTESTPELLSDGSADYVYGPGGLPIEQVTTGGQIEYFFHDALGSTRLLLSSAGPAVDAITYSPWGTTTSSTGTASTPFLFSGAYMDSESGLYYLIHRYYDPATGQFITLDPLLNLTDAPYTYSSDNPVDIVDPTGLWSLNPISDVSEAWNDASSAASQAWNDASSAVSSCISAGWSCTQGIASTVSSVAGDVALGCGAAAVVLSFTVVGGAAAGTCAVVAGVVSGGAGLVANLAEYEQGEPVSAASIIGNIAAIALSAIGAGGLSDYLSDGIAALAEQELPDLAVLTEEGIGSLGDFLIESGIGLGVTGLIDYLFPSSQLVC